MRTILKIASIISITVAALKIGLMGLLTPGWIFFIMICAVLILAGGKKMFTIIAAIAALTLFVRVHGGGSAAGEAVVTQSVLTLVIMLCGFYIMFSGLFKSGK